MELDEPKSDDSVKSIENEEHVVLSLEENPKWKMLTEVLQEIEVEVDKNPAVRKYTYDILISRWPCCYHYK